MQFIDRRDAGRQLAAQLRAEIGSKAVLVLGLPRGGVPVAYEVARILRAPLDVMVVRKLGAPSQPEFALGALGPQDVMVLSEHLPQWFLQSSTLETEIQREQAELLRRQTLYRKGRAALELHGRSIVLVDDGAATGSSMLAAISAARRLEAAEITVGLPVAPADVCEKLRRAADHLVCMHEPDRFDSVGTWYHYFDQTSDQEVCELLQANEAAQR